MALTKDGVTKSKNINKNNSKDENGTSKIWGAKDKNWGLFNSNHYGLSGHKKGKTETQSERASGTNSKGEERSGIFDSIFGGGEFAQATLLDNLKKLARRLELLEEKHNKYVGKHRSRLIASLQENEEFALEFQPEMESLKDDIDELLGVLGASELESTTE